MLTDAPTRADVATHYAGLEAELRRALRASSDAPEALRYLGVVMLHQGRNTEAEAIHRHSLALELTETAVRRYHR